MTKSFQRIIGLLGVSLALASFSAFGFTAGQQLSSAQITQLGDLQVYDIGGEQLRVIPSQASDDAATLLLNSQGVVGVSQNEVAISGASAERIQTQLRQLNPQPLSVQAYESTGITVARYADFPQAIKGLKALMAALPDAHVSLSLQFGKHVPY